MSTRLFLLSLTVLACSSAPPQGDGPGAGVPIEADDRSEPPPSTGFARHASGELVAFDPATGRQLARRPLGFEIVDLEWDERARRVLVTAVEGFDVEGSRVHAFAFDGADFTHEASSEIFPGEIRVLSSPGRVLVIGVEAGSDWYELDDDLGVVGTSGALPQPVLVAEPAADSVLALRRDAHADVVYRVSGFAAGWTSAELTLPRPVPERAAVLSRAGERAWLLSRGDEPGGFAVAGLETAGTLASGSFRPVPGSCGLGAPRSVGVDASGSALVTVTGVAVDRLAVVPTSPGATTRCAELGASLARAEDWVPRNLLVERSGRRAWVATDGGVESFALGASLEKVSRFAGAELRAPMALGR
ncbi:MAG: hypothetical protein IPM35_36985 [Myxococcales bacterium]|nr:hypothetical protein [Myxococcales bacterium]